MKSIHEYLFSEHLLNEHLLKAKTISSHNSYTAKTRTQLYDILKELIQNGETDLNCIDVSAVKDMSFLFKDLNSKLKNGVKIADIDISEWDVSNVVDMFAMFKGCATFNSDLSAWDVGNVTDMFDMFNGCENFNSDISGWNVSNVTDMGSMFYGCKKFDADLSEWDVRLNRMEMVNMFGECDALAQKQLIPDWWINSRINRRKS